MPRGRKKGEKIGRVYYNVKAYRIQGNSVKEVGEKQTKGKPSWADKSEKKIEAGKKAYAKNKDKMTSFKEKKKVGRPKGSKNKPK